jgi:hypothetical protein
VFEQDGCRAFTQDIELSLLDDDEPEEIQIKKALPVSRSDSARCIKVSPAISAS